LLITSDIVAHISVVTLDRNMSTRVGQISGSGVTAIDGTSVVVIAEVLSLRSVSTSLHRVAGINSTGVLVVTSSGNINRSEYTLSSLVI